MLLLRTLQSLSTALFSWKTTYLVVERPIHWWQWKESTPSFLTSMMCKNSTFTASPFPSISNPQLAYFNTHSHHYYYLTTGPTIPHYRLQRTLELENVSISDAYTLRRIQFSPRTTR